MAEDIKRKTTVGILWRGLERTASKGLQFVFSVLIARVLLPEDYGIIAIANLCISLSDILVDSGFSKAIIRKTDRTEEDFNSVFFFNITISLILYGVFWFTAPFLADYYQQELLTKVIRIMTVSLIINAALGVPISKLSISMDFKRIALIETVSMCLAGIVGVWLAMTGYGVMALAIQALSGNFLRLLFYFGSVRSVPSLSISFSSLKQLFSFGSKLLITDYIQRIYNALFTLTIGKRFSAAQLGYYGKADAFASTPSSILSSSLISVTYPAITRIQDDKEAMRRNFVPMMVLSSFIIFPCFFGLGAIAKPLIPLILTEKWSPIVPFLQILLLNHLSISLLAIPNNYLLALGKTSQVLRLHVITKAIGVLLLFPFCRVSLQLVCMLISFSSFLLLLLEIHAVWKEIEFSISEFLKGMIPIVSFSVFMLLGVIYTTRIISTNLWSVLVGCVVGVAIYWGLSAATRNKQYIDLKRMVLLIIQRKNGSNLQDDI